VHFRIRDVFVPDPHELAMELHGDNLLQGRVVDLSDSGIAGSTYAVVKVESVERPVIVPVDKILGVL
jgi:hypothetical protein